MVIKIEKCSILFQQKGTHKNFQLRGLSMMKKIDNVSPFFVKIHKQRERQRERYEIFDNSMNKKYLINFVCRELQKDFLILQQFSSLFVFYKEFFKVSALFIKILMLF